MIKLLIEFAVVLLISFGGTAIAWKLNLRDFWLSIPAGLMISVVLHDLIFASLNIFGQAQFSAYVFYAVLIVGLATLVIKFDKAVLPNLALGTALTVLAVLSTRVLGFRGTPHGDSLWILSFAQHFANGGSAAALDGHTAIKRGFSYPLLLALGPSGEFLSAITPYIFATLGSLVIWFVKSLLGKAQLKRTILFGSLLLLVTVTAVMPLRAIFYVNGHTLTAVGMTAVAASVVISVREKALSPKLLLLACLGVFTASTSRIEGIAMVAIIALPLLAQPWIRRREIIWIIGSGTFAVSLWLTTVNSYIFTSTNLPAIVFTLAMIVGGSLAALKYLDWVRLRIMPIALGAMALIFAAAEVVFRSALSKGNAALFDNLIAGAGMWGWSFVAIGVGLLFGLRKIKLLSSEHRTLLWLTAALVLASLIVKLLDGGQFGNPTLGRLGWSDSLNRMWLQSFVIFLVATLVGLVQNDNLFKSNPDAKANKS